MPATALRQLWAQGEVAYGAAIRLGSTWPAEVLARSGLDFVWIDQEHGLNDDASLVPMLQAMNGTEATPLVRVRANDPVEVGRALDAGSEGVIVPMVETPDQARRAVAACRYAPDGVRSYGSFRLRYLPGGVRRDVLCVVMIESRLGVENAAAIAAVPGVDGVFIGPADLALSLGIEPRAGIQPGVHAEAIATVREACEVNGIVTAITGDAQEMRALGFKMISLGADTLFFERGMTAALSRRQDRP